ncbi:hypothetical protein, partial [Xanthomonas hortorum]|uniref:hypothetical protein n=1 Tax=Xanthomonas hortorum TaxID=56454 RepID=UPI00204344EC
VRSAAASWLMAGEGVACSEAAPHAANPVTAAARANRQKRLTVNLGMTGPSWLDMVWTSSRALLLALRTHKF